MGEQITKAAVAKHLLRLILSAMNSTLPGEEEGAGVHVNLPEGFRLERTVCNTPQS